MLADFTAASLDGAALDECVLGGASFRLATLHGACGRLDTQSVECDFPLDLSGADMRSAALEPALPSARLVVDDRTLWERHPQSMGFNPVHIDVWIARLAKRSSALSQLRVLRDPLGRVAWTAYGPCRERGPTMISDGEDLRGVDLRSADRWFAAYLEDADLRGADLRGVDLWTKTLESVDARDADLSSAHLVGASFVRCDFRGSRFDRVIARSDPDWPSRWQECDLRGARFVGADLTGLDLSSCLTQGADFSDARR